MLLEHSVELLFPQGADAAGGFSLTGGEEGRKGKNGGLIRGPPFCLWGDCLLGVGFPQPGQEGFQLFHGGGDYSQVFSSVVFQARE